MLSPQLSSNTPASSGQLLTVHEVANRLHCSARHVYRLADRGGMPSPVHIGALVRWPQQSIDHWITEGCPSVR